MIRLAIIFFLISMIESKICWFHFEELNELKRMFNDAEHRMEEATRGQRENALIVVGGGRSGKSTLINYLMGNELEAYWLDLYNIKIRKFDNNSRGPEINVGSVSKTSIPSKWNSKRPELQNLDIWDTAGFADNRGPMQDLNNSFYLYHLTRKVENLKFILVINFDDICSDNVQYIVRLLNFLETYFSYGFNTFFPSISVIVSKAPKFDDYDNAIDNEYIYYKLLEQLLSNPNLPMSNVSKDFIQHIIDDNQSLAIFKKAEKVGKLTSDIDVNIFPTIISRKRIIKSRHQDVGVPISENTKFCIRNSNDALLPIDAIIGLAKKLFNLFNEKFHTFCQSNDTNTLRTNNDELTRIDKSFNTALSNNDDAEVKIQVLKNISDDFKNLINMKKVLDKMSLIKFFNSILKTQIMSNVDVHVNILFKSVKMKINSLVASCSRKLDELTEDEYKKTQYEYFENRNKVLQSLQDNVLQLDIPEENRRFLEAFQNFLY